VGFAWAGAVFVLAPVTAWAGDGGGDEDVEDAVGWRIDGTSLALNAGRWPMRRAATCADRGSRTLGVALVVYSRKQATMAWGHASLRVVRCLDGAVRDEEYETYRLSAWNERLFREEHAGEAFLDGPYLGSQRGALVLFRNPDPVDAGWYGDAQGKNREIYELWLDRTPEQLDAIARDAERWYEDQRATLRAEAPLPERYRPLSTNCTAVFRRLIGDEDGGPVTPFAWLRRMEGRALLKVMRPSHALVRRWGGIPADVVRRPRPLLRWSVGIPEPVGAEVGAALLEAAALGPWTVAREPGEAAALTSGR
jgi:hypothetical protein